MTVSELRGALRSLKGTREVIIRHPDFDYPISGTVEKDDKDRVIINLVNSDRSFPK